MQYYVTDGVLDSEMQTIVIHVTMPNNVLPAGSAEMGLMAAETVAAGAETEAAVPQVRELDTPPMG